MNVLLGLIPQGKNVISYLFYLYNHFANKKSDDLQNNTYAQKTTVPETV